MGKKKGKQEKHVPNATNQQDKDAKRTKNYGFGQVSGVDMDDPAIFKVSLPAELETKVKTLILDLKSKQKGDGSASFSLNSKKLMAVYMSLSNVGFKHTQIESALNDTTQYGGDLIDALDWLCLNLNNDQLPDNFSQAIINEEHRLRPERAKFDISLQQNAVPLTSAQETDDDNKSKDLSEKEAVKDWILRYAECSSSDSDCSDVETDPKKSANFDPNELYLELTAKLLDAKTVAAEAKNSGNKKEQKQASTKIREFMNQMSSLEHHRKFNPAVKVKGVMEEDDQIEKRSSRDSQPKGKKDDDELGFDLFTAPVEKLKKEKEPPKIKRSDLEIIDFTYTRKQWTGKSPKQFLIDWIRKNEKSSPPPAYHKIEVIPCLFRARCTVKRKEKSDLVVTPDIVCENVKDAEHLASTLALYHLCRGQRVYQLLPPPYRDVWLVWLDGEKKVKEEKIASENKPRDQLISKLMKKVKLGGGRCGGGASASKTPTTTDATAGDEEDDSWLDLADSDGEQSPAQPDKSTPQKNSAKRPAKHFDPKQNKKSFESRLGTKSYKSLLSTREQLPVYSYKDEIMKQINSQQVVVISGQTGSGKSTQIPRFILEEALLSGTDGRCNIICTEPRRISATSLARRVSDELGDPKPVGSRGAFCGYQIRFEACRSDTTRLLYCTTGVLLRRLQVDPMLENITHVVVDEVHERSVQSDFLLIILRGLLEKRSDFHVILMSATADSEKFSNYFKCCPVIEIPGRTFPVTYYHIEDILEATDYSLDEDSPYALRYDQIVEEDTAQVSVTGAGGKASKMELFWTKTEASKVDKTNLDGDVYSMKTRNTITRMYPERVNLDLIVELLTYIDTSSEYSTMDGAVLIFLPGLAHIQELNDLILADRRFANEDKYQIIALHSVLSADNQGLAFQIPPPGMRKIVIATNIAETGITIPDVVFVIDSGKEKENRYNESNQMSSLLEVFISQASAKQRGGRAGRVREGVCFRLYTQRKYNSMRPFTVPEMLRVPLEELCLHIMKSEMGHPSAFLSQALDPPTDHAIQQALTILDEVGACEISTATLTSLGHHLATLPVNVRIGKMLIYGAIFGCLEQISVIAAAMTDKSPFVVPLGKKDEADVIKQALAVAYSDHLTMYQAYLGWLEAKKQGYHSEMTYCNKCYLKRQRLQDIHNVSYDLRQLVQSSGFEYKEYATQTDSIATLQKNNRVNLIRAVMLSGMYPQVARIIYKPHIDGSKSTKLHQATIAKGTAHVHPSSVNKHMDTSGYVVYHEKVKSSRVFLRETSLVTPLAILLFGGDIAIQHRERLVTVDSWIKFKAYARTAVIVKELRILLDDLLDRKLANPNLNTTNEPLVQIMIEMITAER